MSKINVKELRSALDAALQSIEDDLGIVLSLKGITYGDTYFTAKIEGSLKGELSKEESDYDFYHLAHDLPPRETYVNLTDGAYKIVGWRSRAPKYPVLVIRNGLQFKVSVRAIKKAMET